MRRSSRLLRSWRLSPSCRGRLGIAHRACPSLLLLLLPCLLSLYGSVVLGGIGFWYFCFRGCQLGLGEQEESQQRGEKEMICISIERTRERRKIYTPPRESFCSLPLGSGTMRGPDDGGADGGGDFCRLLIDGEIPVSRHRTAPPRATETR